MNLGKAIGLVRTQREVSREELAERTGFSVSYVSLIERGKRDPGLKTIEKIARGLEVPTSVLVFLASDPSELAEFDRELAQKLSYTIFRLLRDDDPQTSLL